MDLFWNRYLYSFIELLSLYVLEIIMSFMIFFDDKPSDCLIKHTKMGKMKVLEEINANLKEIAEKQKAILEEIRYQLS
jgi:hypothetical protein